MTLGLALWFSIAPAYALIHGVGEYDELKGAAVRVDRIHSGGGLSKEVVEKQEGAKICQLSSHEYSCYSVKALGHNALAIYNSTRGEEVSVVFRDENDRPLAGTQSMEKATRDGFCRRSYAVASYVCYERIE